MAAAISIARGGGNNNRQQFICRKKQQYGPNGRARPLGLPAKPSGSTRDRVAGRQFALNAGELAKLAAAHLQQAIGMLEIVIG